MIARRALGRVAIHSSNTSVPQDLPIVSLMNAIYHLVYGHPTSPRTIKTRHTFSRSPFGFSSHSTASCFVTIMFSSNRSCFNMFRTASMICKQCKLTAGVGENLAARIGQSCSVDRPIHVTEFVTLYLVCVSCSSSLLLYLWAPQRVLDFMFTSRL